MERIHSILTNEQYQTYLNKIKTLEQGRPFCLHTIEHSLDVARIAYILLLEQTLHNNGGNTHGNVLLPDNTIIADALIDSTSTVDYMRSSKEYLYAAALLHDIGRFRQYLYNENHAQASANLAGEILDLAGFDEQEQAIILDIIREHNKLNSDKILIKVFQKADRLSRKCYECKEQNRCYKIEQMTTVNGILY